MNIITAIDKKWGIGCNGSLLFNIPEDMRYFKQMTVGKIVIMGHSTFNSLPNSKPLNNRLNIILSTDINLKIDGAIVCNSIEYLFEILREYDSDDIFVIGGELIYSQLLDFCKNIYITKIDSNTPADRFFPNIDAMDNWELIKTSETKYYNDLSFCFCKYSNNNIGK